VQAELNADSRVKNILLKTYIEQSALISCQSVSTVTFHLQIVLTVNI